MLTALGEKIRGFIGTVGGDSYTTSRKRKLNTEEDLGQSPAKRPRQNTETEVSISKAPRFSLVDWITRQNTSFRDSYYFKVIKDSPRRILQKVKGGAAGSSSGNYPAAAGYKYTATSREGTTAHQYLPQAQITQQQTQNPAFMQFQSQFNQQNNPYRNHQMDKKENMPQVHSTPRCKYPQAYSFTKARQEISPTDNFQFSPSKENFAFKAPQSKSPAGRYSNVSRGMAGPGPISHKSVYERVLNKSAMYKPPFLDKTRGRDKLAARESIRLEERNRYAQLLQQFTTTPIPGTAFGSGPVRHPTVAANTSIFTSTILGSSLLPEKASVRVKERLTSRDSSKISDSGSSDSYFSVNKIQVEPKKALTNNSVIDLTEKSYVEIKSYREQKKKESATLAGVPKPSASLFTKKNLLGYDKGVPLEELTPIIPRQYRQRPTPVKEEDNDEPEIIKVVTPPSLPQSPAGELLRKQLEESRFLHDDWISDISNKYSLDKRNKERQIKQEEIKCRFFKEKRDEWEGQLEEHLLKKLALAEREKPVLEEIFIEEQEDEEEEEFIPLTDEQEDMVDNALIHNPQGQVLSEGFRLQITRKDVATLSGLNWLNDEILDIKLLFRGDCFGVIRLMLRLKVSPVINFYMNMIMERGNSDNMPSVHAFNTFFYPKIISAGHSGVRRWTKKIDLFAMDYILVPIHLGMHWCLAVIDMRKKEICYYDSMGGNNNQCLNALKQYLQDESIDKKKTPYDTSHWKLINVKDIPQQMNGSDCGMFACKFAEYISRDGPITFSQEHMPYFRRKMVLEILMKKLLG